MERTIRVITTRLRADIPDIHGKFENYVANRGIQEQTNFPRHEAERARPSSALLAWLSRDFHGNCVVSARKVCTS